MSKDRLAAMRAQQQGGGGYTDPSYPPVDSYGDGGRGYNGYSANTNQYEMSKLDEDEEMSDFYAEIESIQDDIKQLNANITSIENLHSRSLNNTDDVAAQRNEKELDQLVDDTSAITGDLKRRIKDLERQRSSGRNAAITKQQTGLVKSKFIEAIQHYQTVERDYRQKYKGRMERQFRIVKPDATEEEVKAAVNDEEGGQIFAQALMSSNRYGDSRAAYKEVQQRHQDLQRIEKTMSELATLFQDMAVLVEQQDETLNVIEAHAEQADVHIEEGLKHVDKATDHARAARKKRWICFAIIAVILIIVAIILAIQIPKMIPPKNNNAAA